MSTTWELEYLSVIPLLLNFGVGISNALCVKLVVTSGQRQRYPWAVMRCRIWWIIVTVWLLHRVAVYYGDEIS